MLKIIMIQIRKIKKYNKSVNQRLLIRNLIRIGNQLVKYDKSNFEF